MRAITLALICAFLQAGKYTVRVRELRATCSRLSRYARSTDGRHIYWKSKKTFLYSLFDKRRTHASFTRKDSKFTDDVSVAAQRTPTISYISQEQIKDIGETVELQCSVQYAQEYPILWIKVNKENVHEQVALSTGTALIIRDSRFSLKYDTASTTYILQVGLSRRPTVL